VPYRGYQLEELTLVPRPVRRPVECWQPIVSATPRAMDFMVKYGIKGLVGGGAATMAEGPIAAYRDAAARAGKHWELGQNLGIGIFVHLAKTREQAVREMTPWYEEHVKMFAPLGFVPGITPEQVRATERRGGWAQAGVPTLEHFMKLGSWFAGTSDELVEHLKKLEARFPGLEHINLSTSICTPQQAMIEQFQWIAEDVMPRFKGTKSMAAE
jgi:alkanesulfonate monooxygenase SsuD/methylene tetrahydromethanopterin reductase-like flavin-dependent oxidoreductase (luciferase family)